MKLPGLFTILERLRALEEKTAATSEAVAFNAHRAEERAKQSVPCARCGSVVDLRMRENGPRLLRHGVDGEARSIIACNECIPVIKRAGWQIAKDEAPNQPEVQQ